MSIVGLYPEQRDHPVLSAVLGDMTPHVNVQAQVPDIDAELLAVPPLYGGKADRGPAKERPVHRTIAYMLLKGTPVRQIADLVGCSPNTIYNLQTAPWFKTICAQLAATTQADDVLQQLKSAASGAALRLITLTESANETVALRASDSLLDRVLGKAVTRIQSDVPKVPLDPSEELAALRAEMEALTEERSVGQEPITLKQP